MMATGTGAATAMVIAAAAFCTTVGGGLFALHLKDRLHLILGFSAGAVVAVAFFDLIPEAVVLGTPRWAVSTVLSCVALGFLTYLVLDRIQLLRALRPLRAPRHESHEVHDFHGGRRGALGAASFSAHSFLDGVAIGAALQASAAAGVVVTIAVLAHDFSDGSNTTSIGV